MQKAQPRPVGPHRSSSQTVEFITHHPVRRARNSPMPGKIDAQRRIHMGAIKGQTKRFLGRLDL